MSELPLGTLLSNFKSVALTVFELLAFYTQKFSGSRDPNHAPFWINFWGHVRTVPGKTCVSNLKSVALTIFDLLAFNAQKFRGSRDPATPLLEKFFGSCTDCLWEGLCQI